MLILTLLILLTNLATPGMEIHKNVPIYNEQIIKEPAYIEEYHDVIIIGAGIAGLTAAYFLQEHDIKILEKKDRVGGRACSGSYGGFTYAQGAEYIGEPWGPLKKIIRELNPHPVEIPYPMDAKYYEGEFYYGWEEIALMYIEHSSLRDFLNFASTSLLYNAFHDFVPDFDEDSRIAYLDYMTAVEWFDEQGFPNIFVDTYNVSSKGLFGANIHEISALSFIPEIAYDYEIFALGFPYSYEGFKKTHLRLSLLRKFLKSRYSLFKKSFENRNYMDPNSEKDKDSYESKNHTGAYSFEKGLTELTNAIGEHLGDKIQLNSTAIQVSRYEEDNYIVVYRDKEGNNHTMTCKVVILAVPAPIALWIAPSLLNDEQKEIIEQIEFSSYITVALFSGQPIFNKAFDLAVPNDFFFTDIYDATWIQRYYNDSLKDSPHHIITVYVPPKSYKNRSVLSLSDHEILNKIYQDLESIFPGASQKVTGYDITRFPYAYPVMTFGAYHRLSRLREITSGSFLLAGDSTIYPTFESALYSGYLAAKKAEDYIIRPGGC